MSLVFLWDSLRFHAFLLSLLSTLDGPFLGEMRFADSGLPLPLLVLPPRHSYFFKFDFFANKSSFFPVNFQIEFSQPRISQDNAILPQIGDIELLGNLLLPSSYTENAGFADDSSLIFCSIHVVYLAGSPQVFGIESPSYHRCYGSPATPLRTAHLAQHQQQ
jgi:hypothetical protein